jgi:hypothetical protein
MQRYIPASVQRSDSNTSKNGVMDGNVAWVLLLTYFRASSRHRWWRRRDSLLGEERDGRERWLVASWPTTSQRENKEQWWCRARKDVRLGTGCIDKRASSLWSQRAATVIQTTRGIRWWQHGARQWSACEVSATWSWLRERDGRAMSRCRTVGHWKGCGPTVRKMTVVERLTRRA